MWIFWTILFILSSSALFVFVKQKRKFYTVSEISESPEKSSALVKNVAVKFFHSQTWLAVVNNVEKVLRRIRIIFSKIDRLVLNVIDRVRGHSLKIVQKNLEQKAQNENSNAKETNSEGVPNDGNLKN